MIDSGANNALTLNVFSALIEAYGDLPLRRAFTEIGGWPVIDPKWPLTPNLDLVDVILRMFRMGFYHDAFVSISVRPDQYNNQRNLINVSIF